MISFMHTVDALLSRGLCDHCLGRQLGKLATGTTNDERGRTLKLMHAMMAEFSGGHTVKEAETDEAASNEITENEDDSRSMSESQDTIAVPTPNRFHHGDPDIGKCSLCGGLFRETDTFTDLVIGSIKDLEYETYLVGSIIDDDILNAEDVLQEELHLGDHSESIKSEMNRVIGLKVFERIGKEVSFTKPDVVAVVDTRFDTVSLQLSPIFLYGRYQKLDRTIPQTIWNCKRCRGKGCEYCDLTGKIYPTSVQEIIGNVILEVTGGSRHLFHGMGREDIDARMLGTGRPFILEISNPRVRKLDLSRMTELVNSTAPEKVTITDLRYCSRKDVSTIKNMKSDKSYLAEVEFDENVDPKDLQRLEDEFTGAEISQRTPTRVAHRRSDLVRKRKVININWRLHDGRHAAFTIKGESGLYIKELIHGNDGRTQPSVSEFLGTGCTVLSLDVLAVHYENDLDTR